MTGSSPDQTQWMIDGLRSGENAAIGAFIERYGRSLERVADKNIATQMGRRFGADDIVQSVCRTFVRRAQGGEFQLDDSESLWRLLCAITLTKVRENARFHLRQKRSLAQETHPSASADEERDVEALMGAVAGPGPGELAEFADTFASILGELDDEERRVIDMKLQQQENDEIAETLGCSERTVRRLLGRLQERFEASFGGD